MKLNDGKYTWTYDMDMKQNRSVLNLVLKIVTGILAFIFLFLGFLSLRDGDMETFLEMGGVVALCSVVIIAICYLAYWWTTKKFGGVYSWCYEMDEEGIRYTTQGWYWLSTIQRYQEIVEFSHIEKF